MKRKKKKETKDGSKGKNKLKAAGKTIGIISMSIFLNGVMPPCSHALDPRLQDPGYDLSDMPLEDLEDLMNDAHDAWNRGEITYRGIKNWTDKISDEIRRKSPFSNPDLIPS